jgi:dephospho-CoA kinase
MTKPFVIGLVGGMGSGKSRVAEAFVRRGARLISGDGLGHEGLLDPAIREKVAQRWGDGVLGPDGRIDRKKLGAVVFADPAELRALEALVHPYIERRFVDEVGRARRDGVRLVVLDAAVMLEAGWNNVCDRIVYVHAPRETRLARLSAQRGWDAAEVARRERAQLPLADKAARADAAIDNAGPIEQTQRRVDELLAGWGIPARGEPGLLEWDVFR